MKSPYSNSVPPYSLPSHVVYFHDWRYVNTGGYSWRARDGQGVPMMSPGGVPPMRYEHPRMPAGVYIEAQAASKSECVLHARQTGDMGLIGGSVIRENGAYRLWYESWLMRHYKEGTAGEFNALRYAESADGFKWKFPKVGRKLLAGDKHQNVVYGAGISGRRGYHGGSVFVDPSAPKRERYKAFHLGKASADELAAYRKKRPRDIDEMTLKTLGPGGYVWALFGAVSPDGLRWRPLPEPLIALGSDTANICDYDPVLEKYVAYVRTWFFHRRTIGRVTGDDFRRFEGPEEVFWPDATQAPHDTWYANGKTTVPGAPDYHVMFPMRWHLPTDEFEFHLAASPDNAVWGFVPGPGSGGTGRSGAVCQPGAPGAWDAGVVGPVKGMVELGGDRVGIFYSGTPVPHKYPRRPPFGGLAWAWWPRGRLTALRCPMEGSFALWPLKDVGRSVRLNFRAKAAGEVRVEVLSGGKPIAGRAFDDCDPLTGDRPGQAVSWRGRTDLGHAEGAPVELCFRLRHADLFAVEFR